MVICLEWGADLHMAQLMPLPLTVSCFSEIQIGFTFLVPAHLGSPGKRAVKRVYVCMYVCILSLHTHTHIHPFYWVCLATKALTVARVDRITQFISVNKHIYPRNIWNEPSCIYSWATEHHWSSVSTHFLSFSGCHDKHNHTWCDSNLILSTHSWACCH